MVVLAHADLSVAKVERHAVHFHQDLSILRCRQVGCLELDIVQTILLSHPLFDLLWCHGFCVIEVAKEMILKGDVFSRDEVGNT